MSAYISAGCNKAPRVEQMELNRWEDEGGAIVERNEETPWTSTGLALGRCVNLLLAATILESRPVTRGVATVHSLPA
jgi:hypothetical protein